MAIEHNPKNGFFKSIASRWGLKKLTRAVTASYEADERIKTVIDAKPGGYELCIGLLSYDYAMLMSKVGDSLCCSYVEDYTVNEGVYICFKNLNSLLAVLKGKESFSGAYLQSRIVVYGKTDDAVDYIRMMDVVQRYAVGKLNIKRFKAVTTTPVKKENAVRARIFFRGWL